MDRLLYPINNAIVSPTKLIIMEELTKQNYKGITNSAATGNSISYSFTVKTNCELYSQRVKDIINKNHKQKDKTKESNNNKRYLFVYSLSIMDLKTRIYITFASSMK